MTPKSTISGIVLISATLLLPFLGWKLTQKAHSDDHFDEKTEKYLSAAQNGQTDIIAASISHGMPVDIGKDEGVSALLLASFTGKTETVKLLLDKGADMRASFHYWGHGHHRTLSSQPPIYVAEGSTPLAVAIQNRHVPVVKLLLERGASTDPRSNGNQSVVAAAMQSQSSEMVMLLVDHGAPVSSTDGQGDTLLTWAVQKGDVALAKKMLEKGANVDTININRENALLLAARNNLSSELTLMLAQRTKNPNIVDGMGSTPLTYAVFSNSDKLVEALLKSGADPNHADAKGVPLLIKAVQNGNASIVRRLIRAHADKTVKDNNGMTAMKWAESLQNTEIQQILSR